MSEWDSYALDWDDDPGAQAYAQAAFSSLLPVLESADTELGRAEVLDFGCGTGLLTERLVERGASVLGVDTSPAMLDVLRAKIGAHNWTDVATSAELPDSAASYDLIVCSSVCSFVDDYPAMARQLADLLVPGGVFVQWDWERETSTDSTGDGNEDAHGLSRAEIADALNAAGLEKVSVDVGFEVAMGEQVMRPLMGHGRRSTN